MENNTNITNLPSHDALIKQVHGKLSVDESKEMESFLKGDEFFADAYEGYKLDAPSLSEVENLKRAVNYKAAGQKFNYHYFLSVFILSAMFYLATVSFVKTTKSRIKKHNVAGTEATFNKAIIKSDVIALSEVDTNMAVAKKLSDENEIIESEVVANNKCYSKIETIKPIYIKSLSQTKIEKKLSPLLNNNNAPVKYISDILVVDYTKVKGRKNVSDKPLLSVPAYSEKKKYINDGATVLKVNTNDILEKAINNFGKENYTVTLKYLNQLEEIYPKDLNVLFYKAMSYYKLDKAKQAIPYFDKSIENEFTTFQQDAMWYKALALLSCNEKKLAVEVLKQLVSSDGYYTKEAEKTLQTLSE